MLFALTLVFAGILIYAGRHFITWLVILSLILMLICFLVTAAGVNDAAWDEVEHRRDKDDE